MDTIDESILDAQDRIFPVRVQQVRFEAQGINSYELVRADGADLPSVGAGSHLDIHLPGGLVRQYSLSGDPADRRRYTIGVLREEAGRGGSRLLQETLQVQHVLNVSVPRNNFALVAGARRHILIGGGIGITPLKSMAHELAAAGSDFELHYCAKSPDHAAFRDEIAALGTQKQIFFHYDGGIPGQGLAIAELLARPSDGDHVYFCGPPGFMRACAEAASHWPAGTVHSEYFSAPVNIVQADVAGEAEEFFVEIASTGLRFGVPADRSIVDVLADAGILIETSCVSGLCGSCKTKYLAGAVDHRDYILSEDERDSFLTTCVSRATSPVLTLDL